MIAKESQKSKTLQIRITQEEYEKMEKDAHKAKARSVSAWARNILLNIPK